MYSALNPIRSAMRAENISKTPGARMNSPRTSRSLRCVVVVMEGVLSKMQGEMQRLRARFGCPAQAPKRPCTRRSSASKSQLAAVAIRISSRASARMMSVLLVSIDFTSR